MAQESRRSPGSIPPIVAWVMVGIFAASVPIVAVVSYAVGVRSEKRARKGRMVELLRFRRDLDPGEEITKKDIQVVEVERLVAIALGKVVPSRDFDFVVGRILNQSVRKDDWVKYRHVTVGEGIAPVRKDMVAVPLELDPRNAPGDILRVYDRVNILAKLSVDEGPLRTYRVIEGVRVLAVGGRAARDRPGRKGVPTTERAGPGSYSTIVIEVPNEISLDLANVLSHRVGDLQIEICGSQMVAGARAARVNPALGSLAVAARAAPRQEADPAGQPEP